MVEDEVIDRLITQNRSRDLTRFSMGHFFLEPVGRQLVGSGPPPWRGRAAPSSSLTSAVALAAAAPNGTRLFPSPDQLIQQPAGHAS